MPVNFDDLDDGLSTAMQTFEAAKESIRAGAHIANGGDRARGVDCLKCGGSGQTRWGRCFRCDGSGEITARSAAASKARVTRERNDAERHAEFLRANADVSKFLADNADWSDFYRSLNDQLIERGSLSENQIAAVRRGMEKIAARRQEKAAERVAARPAVDISAIQTLFARAAQKIAKRPIFRTDGFQIETDREVGIATLWIKDTTQGKYVGKIEGGRFNAFRAATAATLPAIEAVAADPTASAIAYAHKFKSCCCCGRTLRNPVSVHAVVGPICAENWGLEHLRIAAAEAIAEIGRAHV